MCQSIFISHLFSFTQNSDTLIYHIQQNKRINDFHLYHHGILQPFLSNIKQLIKHVTSSIRLLVPFDRDFSTNASLGFVVFVLSLHTLCPEDCIITETLTIGYRHIHTHTHTLCAHINREDICI